MVGDTQNNGWLNYKTMVGDTHIYDNGNTQGTREAKSKLWKRALRASTNPRRGEDTLMVIVVFLFAILFTNPGRGETFDDDIDVDIEVAAYY